MAESIEITVNGAVISVPSGTTVSGLLDSMGMADKRVAVERNREVVPRAQHTQAVLQSGDTLEVVAFVGGG